MEHKKISERLLSQSQLPIKSEFAGQDIIEHVLSPLNKTWTGFKLLHDRAESNISHGLIRSTRDLELVLTFGADPRDSEDVNYFIRSELHSSPWTRYTKYCYQVIVLCDNFMGSAGPGWRHQYFVTELDLVLRKHLTSTQQQLSNLDAILIPDFSSNDLNSTLVDIIMAPPDQAYYNLLGSVNHNSTVGTCQELSAQVFHEVPGDFTNETPWHTQYEPLRPASCKLPDLMTQELPDGSACELSPVSISPHSTDDLEPSRCDRCGEPFHSNSKDLPNNLKRHQDTVCARKNRFQCSENECQKSFPRKDYLKAHYLKEHENNAHTTSYQPDRRRSKRIVNRSAVLDQPPVNLPAANFF